MNATRRAGPGANRLITPTARNTSRAPLVPVTPFYERAFDEMSEPPFIIKYMSDNLLLSAADDVRADGPAEPGPQEPDPVLVPLERLEERICELAAHLAAGTCRFLQLVAEFDARGGWATWDLPSCAAWLAWKCQVAPGTAREQVRVARALASLPRITAEFAAGRMSYAKVRALTRIATTATEADLAEIAGPMTAAQCERFVAAHRKASDTEELASWAARRVSVHVGEDGSMTISAKLPAADGAVVLQALRAAAGDCEHPHRPHDDTAEDTRPTEHSGRGASTCRASLADALVQVAGAYLTGKIAAAGNPDIYQVIVHVGPEALTTGPDRSDPATGQPGVSAETPSPAPATTSAPGHPPAQPPPAPADVSAETSADPPGDVASPACRFPTHPAHPATLPPRRRPGHQPRRRASPRLPRHGVLDAARPRRQPARRRPAAPPGHPRAAPRRPRTRQGPLPVPRLQLPAHRHPPHHRLGQGRQDPAA